MSAVYKNELYKMLSVKSFGELEDSEEEFRKAEEFKIQNNILLAKLALQLRRNRNEIFGNLGITLGKFMESTSTSLKLSILGRSIYEMYFFFNPSEDLSEYQKEVLTKKLEDFFSTSNPLSTFEKRAVDQKIWLFNMSKTKPTLNTESGEYEVELNSDFSCTFKKEVGEFDNFETQLNINGFWEIWNDKIFKFSFTNYTRVPFVKHQTLSGPQRAEWYIKGAKLNPYFFQLMRAH